MKKKTRIVELVISDDSQELTIDAISLVSSPAIEEDFVFFGKEKNNLTFAKIDEEKRMLVSPALIPLKQIYRYDAATDSDYYVYFSKETVRQASELYLKHNNHHKATYEHSDRVSGVLTIESWIKESEQDKSKMYGFDLPIGTWFVKMKIENDELWSRIKSGELKGLSIEGYFIDRMETMSKKEFTTKEVRTALKELLSVQKVELNLIDDLKISVNSLSSNESILQEVGQAMVKINSQMSSILPKAKDRAKVGKSMIGATDKKIELAQRNVKRVEQRAKELGVNLNEIPFIKEIDKLIEDNKKGLRTVSFYVDSMESISKVKL